MFTSNAPDPESVLQHVAGAVRVAREALDDGISFADTTLEGLPIDRYMWSHLVRYHARRVLTSAEQSGWRVGRDLPNSGIEIVCEPFVLRVLKSQAGAPPNPGWSGARRSFWSQGQQLAFALDGDAIVPHGGANLLLDWSVTSSREVTVALSKPMGVWRYKGAPKLEWRRVVSFSTAVGLRFVPLDEDVAVEPLFDLSELPDEGEGS